MGNSQLEHLKKLLTWNIDQINNLKRWIWRRYSLYPPNSRMEASSSNFAYKAFEGFDNNGYVGLNIGDRSRS